MRFRQFDVMLAAGLASEARDALRQLTITSFPHIEDEGTRRSIVTHLQRLARLEQDEAYNQEEVLSELAKLRTMFPAPLVEPSVG